MSKKNKYTDLVAEIKAGVQKTKSSRYSDSDRTLLTTSLIDTPEYEVDVYIPGKDEPVTMKPVEAYRESLKPVLKQFGVDDAELGRIQEVEFGKNHAKAFNNLADIATTGYLETGRKMILPITDRNKSQMEFMQVEKPQKQEDTRMPVEVEPGVYKSVPTGNRQITEAHCEIKASNKIPPWLVKKEKIEG